MKALSKVRPGPGLSLVDVDPPTASDGEALLRVLRGSVCGTDLHIEAWDSWAQARIHPPRIVGHEFCGEIVEIVGESDGFKAGDLVAAESHIVDGDCRACADGQAHVCTNTKLIGVDVDGAFRPYVAMPVSNLRRIPAGILPSHASMLEPLGNAVHTAMAGPIEGRRGLILGLGPIGLMAVETCRALGAEAIVGTEISPYRKRLAEDIGIDAVLDPLDDGLEAELRRWAPGGFDFVLEMSGRASSFLLGLEHCRPGGRFSLLGIYADKLDRVDLNQLIWKGLEVQGIVGRRIWETWDQMDWLITEKGLRLDKVATHEVALPEYEKAFELLRSGQAGKVVLQISES